MQVAHVHWTSFPVTGGVEVHCTALVSQLADLDVDVKLLSGMEEQTALRLGTTATSAELDQLVNALRSADVVHWHNPQWHKPDVTAAVAARLRELEWHGRLIFDIHNLDAIEDHWEFLGKLSREYVVHSEFIGAQLQFHVPGVEIHVLPLALTSGTEDYVLPRPGATTVLQPTRLTTWKGSDLSLQAAADLLAEGLDIGFVHAGTDHLIWKTNIQQRVMDTVSRWQETGQVRFVHYSPQQSWNAIAQADLVVHPTADHGPHGEPFSLSVAQAIICGTPVVATESGHLPTLLDGYSGAWLVPPGDQDAVTDAIREATKYPRRADKAKDKALADRLLTAFTSSGAKHLAFYQQQARS